MKPISDTTLYNSTEARRVMGCRTQAEFFMLMVQKRVLRRISDRYVVHPQYAGADFTRSIRNHGKWYLFWTQRGIDFLFDLRDGQGRLESLKRPA